ncbi:ATP-dependent DNA helicase PIF1 [Exaiptasia diaphana]|nr:ATP-dependent DNA helicase PIF1 [Exaiptasia diaphana]
MPKKLSAKTLKVHTNAHADRDRPTLKDGDERTFRNGSFRDPLSKGSNEVKQIHTKFILDHVDRKKITYDKTNDTDKTNNSTEMKASKDVESIDVDNKVTYEQSKFEQLTFKTAAILESPFPYINNTIQSYLKSSYKGKLPTTVSIFECNYEMQYSSSYTGNIHDISSSIDFEFCMPLRNAVQILVEQNYNMFLMTIQCNTVAIYCKNNGGFKIFDSHARDVFGFPHPQGTCVLIDTNSYETLISYFQNLYARSNNSNISFELRGVCISELRLNSDSVSQNNPKVNLHNNETDKLITTDNSSVHNNTSNVPNDATRHYRSAILYYCIGFSIIKSCKYWNSETLDSISDHGKNVAALNQEYFNNSSMPQKLNIYDAEILITQNTEKKGKLTDLTQIMLEELILHNTKNNTGFLLCLHDIYIGCIFHKAKTTDYYIISINDDATFEKFEKESSLQTLITKIFDFIAIKLSNYEELHFQIKFIFCSCDQLSNTYRKNILRKHKSDAHKQAISETHRLEYTNMDPALKRRRLTKIRLSSQIHYKSMNAEQKEKRLSAMRQYRQRSYKSLNKIDKEKQLMAMRNNSQVWYNSMDAGDKEERLSKMQHNFVNWYQSIDESQKQKLLERKKHSNKDKQHDIAHYISNFKNKITQGPYYICTVCNRLLYKKTVIKFKEHKYNIQNNILTKKKSFDDKHYICKTCHSKLLKKQIPCQAAQNNLHVDEIPPDLAVLGKLEQILIAQRILFEKILIMPKGRQRKIKGAICNVPVECDQTCNVLPRPSERSGIILLKLKRKLQFRGHVYYEPVRTELIFSALKWLKINNPLYADIEIDMENGYEYLTSMQHIISDENIKGMDYVIESNDSVINEKIIRKNKNMPYNNNTDANDNDDANENYTDNANADDIDDANDDDAVERDDPLNEHRIPTNETCLQSVIPDYQVTVGENHPMRVALGNEIHEIAPGENKHPVSFMTDKLCEEMAFPVLFPKGKFGYHVDRPIKLSPVKYFNARLLHYSGRFATNPEYLFFAQFVIEQKKVSDSINIALKKIHSQPISASQLRSNAQSFQSLICQDQAYLFLRQIPGTPPYWQKFMYEVVAMVKQLGIPTWFMTLSCADLRWPELFQIIARTQGKNISNEEVDALSYNEKCSMLNLNPVVVAKHFQYRVETFFTEVLLSNANPIGKIVYYALRIEFQMRGSPHLHALIWTSDCPKLNTDNKQAYIDFIDKHVHAHLPDENEDPQLHELVKTYQKHSHSKTCRKYKNIRCRFNFGQFFTNRTIVAEPLSNDINEHIKSSTLEKRKEILTLVKGKIDDVLNPSKPTYESTLTESDIFNSVGITQEQYYSALSISPDSDYELHLKRPIDSCFINNYFIAGIKGFAANVDLQPVFNHYKCVTYEAKAANMNVREGLKKIGAAFLSTREVSSQEAVYRCMPELWLRKIFPAAIFISTDLPDKRIRMAKSQQELEELDDESTEVYKSNMIERYTKRPHSIPSVNKLCLAEFVANYYKDYKKEWQEIPDAQPQVLTDNLIESQHTTENEESRFPDKIRLIDSNEIMKCRKVRAVIRYHTPNKEKEPEKYFHHLLMLYYPWRDENKLLASDGTYATTFYDPDIQPTVEHNRSIFELDNDAVTDAFENLRNNQGNIHSYDSMNDQENDDIHSHLLVEQSNSEESFYNEQIPSHLSSIPDNNTQQAFAISRYMQPSDMPDDELRHSVRSLNKRQRYTFNHVLNWCRNKVKNINCKKPQDVAPIYVFVTGGGGAGKSHLIKTIYHTVTKTFRHVAVNPELPSVLLMAPTGVAAININGTTINTALGIPKEAGATLKPLSDQNRTQLRLLLSELRLIIVDEISMVGNTTLLHIHQRLKEIFDTPASKLFAGISIIAGGDFYQLPPIKKKTVFDNFNTDTYNLCHPWHLFRMTQLIDNMRSKDDKPFIEMLNRFRTASHTEQDIKHIQSRSIKPDNANFPSDAIHIYAENKPVDEYNNNKLSQLSGQMFQLKAQDRYPPNVSQADIERVLSKGRSDTGGLDYNIHVKEGARVMLTSNINIADRLINGQIGTLIKIHLNQSRQKPTIIYIRFDDNKAGKNVMSKSTNQFVKDNNVVPIEQVLAKIKIRPGKPSSPEIERVQFPITLAYAVTIHKIQGMTLDKVVVSFELFRQKSFNYGQVYVALSRSRSLNGLYTLGQIQDKHVRADPRVHKEYQRLRETQPLEPPEVCQKKIPTFAMCLINIRSIQKHSIDVKHDSNLFNSDMICFTETQLLPNTDDIEILSNLHPLKLLRQDHTSDRHSSLAVSSKSYVEITQYHHFPEINAITLTAIHTIIIQLNINILLLYRKNGRSISQYVQNLERILNSNKIDIVFGDFNIDYFNDSEVQALNTIMEQLGYIQTVDSPTFISGSLLDHVYIKNEMLNVANICTSVIPVYYSDHEAIKILFNFI